MLNNFKINTREIDKIKKISKEEKKFRVKNLSLFNEVGFPNKKNEDWKFSDLKTIISKNFDKFIPTKKKTTNKKYWVSDNSQQKKIKRFDNAALKSALLFRPFRALKNAFS